MMEINIIGIAVITVVFIVISFMFINSIGLEIGKLVPENLRKVAESFFQALFPNRFNPCKAYSSKQLSLQEFQSLLLAAYKGQCEETHAFITLDFSLTKDDIDELTKIGDLANKGDLVVYGKAKPIGAGSIVIEGNPGSYPIKKWDQIELWQEGRPQPDLLLKVSLQGCDPYDNDCDPACSFKKGICDPLCYRNRQSEGALCDIDCVDKNGNGRIDEGDLDNVCDLDCYNDKVNPDRAYDPDCAVEQVKKDNGLDGICEPDSNGVKDGVCDVDCGRQNYICDPDCDGIVDSGNPGGIKDDDCYRCDKTCNNYCSPICSAGDDPDCEEGYDQGLTECCGNGVCGNGEDCGACAKDCPAGNTCEDIGKVCCPAGSDDQYGCSQIWGVDEGGGCSCDNQCKDGSVCDDTGHCCPDGEEWNGTACEISMKYQIVFVPIGYSDFNEFRNNAEKSFEYFVNKVSPFKECSNPYNHVEMKLIDIGECSIGTGCGICTSCNSQAENCVAKSKYSTTWNKIAALCKGNSCVGACGCAHGIPADSSSTNMVTCRGVLYEIPSHEMGHTFGLYHLNCGGAGGACNGPNRPDCSEPNKANFVMDYCNGMNEYGPAGYDYLKNVVFKDYLKGC